jgi:hypothetical protein
MTLVNRRTEEDSMRLTIVDRESGIVRDVFSVATVTPGTFAQLAGMASDLYTDASYRWFVTQHDAMPQHAQHDRWGIII